MKIYFAGSIRGGQNDVKLYAEIIEELKNYGAVLTEHVAEGLDELDAKDMNDTDVYDYDMMRLLDSDIVIAEVTTPSIGVGYEIGVAEALEKTIVCLFRPNSGVRRSAMLASEGISHIEYKTFKDLQPKLAKLFED